MVAASKTENSNGSVKEHDLYADEKKIEKRKHSSKGIMITAGLIINFTPVYSHNIRAIIKIFQFFIIFKYTHET
uniref:Uncharacterized protein n=1 Tax=Anguilla anguilla TaxID=7936 RepID=A0A0E9TFQ7_ANGAN